MKFKICGSLPRADIQPIDSVSIPDEHVFYGRIGHHGYRIMAKNRTGSIHSSIYPLEAEYENFGTERYCWRSRFGDSVTVNDYTPVRLLAKKRVTE